jgi:hypothetical protein
MIRRFEVFRPNPPENYYASGAANPPGDVQFEGVVFSDGTVVVRWLTQFRSHSVWSSLGELEQVHGHPEYGTEWRWFDDSMSGETVDTINENDSAGRNGDTK